MSGNPSTRGPAGAALFLAVLAAIVLLGLLLRVHQVELRPLHNDESTAYYFVESVAQQGYYKYSHENYHGPSYYYLTRLFTGSLGYGELGLRGSAIAFGLLTLLLLGSLARSEGYRFVLIAAGLAAISPSLVFYSRYAIHEMIFLFASVWLAMSVYRWAVGGGALHLYSGGAAVGLLVSTKETFVIAIACIVGALVFVGRPVERIRTLGKQWPHLLGAVAVSGATVALFYTGGFQWNAGLKELFLGVPQWVGRGSSDVGHHKPWHYYFAVMHRTEPYVLYSAVIAAAGFLGFLVYDTDRAMGRLRDDGARFLRFVAGWALLAFLVYSYVPYKTPWLVINITLPLILVVAQLADGALRRADSPRMAVGVWALLGVFVLIGLRNTVHYNYDRLPLAGIEMQGTQPYGPGNPFSYNHTAAGMLELDRDIQEYWKAAPDARLLLGSTHYWPLPYYLRNKKDRLSHRLTRDPRSLIDTYGIMILDPGVKWKNLFWTRKDYRIADHASVAAFFKNLDSAQPSPSE